jgi:hypothetical protein
VKNWKIILFEPLSTIWVKLFEAREAVLRKVGIAAFFD